MFCLTVEVLKYIRNSLTVCHFIVCKHANYVDEYTIKYVLNEIKLTLLSAPPLLFFELLFDEKQWHPF